VLGTNASFVDFLPRRDFWEVWLCHRRDSRIEGMHREDWGGRLPPAACVSRFGELHGLVVDAIVQGVVVPWIMVWSMLQFVLS
jgi:hypothetical protein